MKKSFSILEIIFVIVLISIALSFIKSKNKDFSKLEQASEKIILYLNYTRYTAHIDNKYDIEDNEWFKKIWTLKFQNCSKDEDGLYYVVYSDESGGTAHFKKDECLKDPLNNKYLYSNYDCQASQDESKYVLLTKEFGVKKVDISCNTTSTIGQISFGYDGKVYSSLGDAPKEITQKCIITLFDNDGNSKKIFIEPKTGYIYTS